MERLNFRSTSLVDLQAELHERDLIREAEVRHERRQPRTRGLRHGLRQLVRRILD